MEGEYEREYEHEGRISDAKERLESKIEAFRSFPRARSRRTCSPCFLPENDSGVVGLYGSEAGRSLRWGREEAKRRSPEKEDTRGL